MVVVETLSLTHPLNSKLKTFKHTNDIHIWEGTKTIYWESDLTLMARQAPSIQFDSSLLLYNTADYQSMACTHRNVKFRIKFLLPTMAHPISAIFQLVVYNVIHGTKLLIIKTQPRNTK
jgi:hypothetical protein